MDLLYFLWKTLCLLIATMALQFWVSLAVRCDNSHSYDQKGRWPRWIFHTAAETKYPAVLSLCLANALRAIFLLSAAMRTSNRLRLEILQAHGRQHRASQQLLTNFASIFWAPQGTCAQSETATAQNSGGRDRGGFHWLTYAGVNFSGTR